MRTILLLFGIAAASETINNSACKKCIHFKPSKLAEYSSSIGRCDMFSTTDFVTDELTYDFASNCRNDELKCGEQGKYFKKDLYYSIKKFKHNISEEGPIAIVYFLCVVYFVMIFRSYNSHI